MQWRRLVTGGVARTTATKRHGPALQPIWARSPRPGKVRPPLAGRTRCRALPSRSPDAKETGSQRTEQGPERTVKSVALGEEMEREAEEAHQLRELAKHCRREDLCEPLALVVRVDLVEQQSMEWISECLIETEWSTSARMPRSTRYRRDVLGSGHEARQWRRADRHPVHETVGRLRPDHVMAGSQFRRPSGRGADCTVGLQQQQHQCVVVPVGFWLRQRISHQGSCHGAG